MSYLNQVVLLGRLTADPELREIPDGSSVANFAIAVNRPVRQTDSAETPRSRGEFFACEAWGNWAENFCRTARKGAVVLVSGRLRQDVWEDKAGGRRSRVCVRAACVFHLALVFEAAPASRPRLDGDNGDNGDGGRAGAHERAPEVVGDEIPF